MRVRFSVLASVCLSVVLSGCGGSKPEAESPEPGGESSDKSESKAEGDSAKEESGGGADEEKSDKKDGKKDESAASEEKSEKKVVRTAKDVLTAEGVLFVFSFAASEPYQAAEKKCTEKAKDDPKKKADCMTKASEAFDNDGYAFQEEDGKWLWLTVRRKGNGLVTLHKLPIEFTDEKDHSVTLKVVGPDKGTKPGGMPKQVTIDVPGESEISVTDPKQGRLVYQAKLGLLGEGKR